MQSLKYAIRFISASFSLAAKNPRLQKSWFYLGVGSLVVLILWFLPLSLVVAFIGLQPAGMILVGLICTLALITLLVFGEIFALYICQAFDTVSGDREEQEIRWPFLPSHWIDVALFALSLPGKLLYQAAQQRFSSNKSDPSPWLDATYLILPVICLEDLSLSQAVERLNQIVGEHLLRFRADLVRVRLVAGVIQWILILGGLALGFITGINVADPSTAGIWQRVLGTGAGMVLAWLLTMVGLVFGTFTRTMYTTALYQWVKNVEAARQTQAREKGSPPEILRQVLGKYS